MCKHCRDKEEKRQAEAKKKQEFTLRVGSVKHSLLQLLSTDKIKGSNYVNLLHMTDSKDQENLVVAQEIIKQKIDNFKE